MTLSVQTFSFLGMTHSLYQWFRDRLSPRATLHVPSAHWAGEQGEKQRHITSGNFPSSNAGQDLDCTRSRQSSGCSFHFLCLKENSRSIKSKRMLFLIYRSKPVFLTNGFSSNCQQQRKKKNDRWLLKNMKRFYIYV